MWVDFDLVKKPEVINRVFETRKVLQSCYLCGNPVSLAKSTGYVGVFLPDTPLLWSDQSLPKNAGFLYGICKTCAGLPDRHSMVEVKILGDAEIVATGKTRTVLRFLKDLEKTGGGT